LRPSARRCHTPDSFRPCRSSRLRRFSPLNTLQVFCALQPTMGFAAFQDPGCRALRSAHKERPARPATWSSFEDSAAVATLLLLFASPRSCVHATHRSFRLTRPLDPSPAALHPPKLSPRRNPCHVTVVVALSPLLPAARSLMRSPVMGDASRFAGSVTLASGPCSFDESVAPSRRCRRQGARCSLGFPHLVRIANACAGSLPRRGGGCAEATPSPLRKRWPRRARRVGTTSANRCDWLVSALAWLPSSGPRMRTPAAH